MQMSNAEIVASYKNSVNRNRQVGVLAELNACDKERIKEILIEGGVPESELPKKRGPKPKSAAYSKKDTSANKESDKANIVHKEEDEKVALFHVEEIKEMPRRRHISEIVETGPQDRKEAERLERYKCIPDAVKNVCLAEMRRLYSKIVELEKQYDSIADYMQGEECVCLK